MRTQLLIAAALALSATVTSANALTVVNSDKVGHAVMVTPQGGKAHRLVIKASHAGNYNCARGCELKLGTHKAHYDAKTQKIRIKGGMFVQA
jgi:phage gp45-like